MVASKAYGFSYVHVHVRYHQPSRAVCVCVCVCVCVIHWSRRGLVLHAAETSMIRRLCQQRIPARASRREDRYRLEGDRQMRGIFNESGMRASAGRLHVVRVHVSRTYPSPPVSMGSMLWSPPAVKSQYNCVPVIDR